MLHQRAFMRRNVEETCLYAINGTQLWVTAPAKRRTDKSHVRATYTACQRQAKPDVPLRLDVISLPLLDLPWHHTRNFAEGNVYCGQCFSSNGFEEELTLHV